ncbi:MAG TPA: hypothetical protein VFI08_04800 [Spirochaetia bacterium]|nr:hypothetical protein [Spirochaetia bacterium]
MRKLAVLAMAGGALLLVVSCASTPAPKPAPAAPAAAPAAAAPGAPDQELAQAKDLKAKVDSFGLGDFDADDYAAANKDLQAGQDSYGKDNAASKKSLDSAISEYNAVLSKGGDAYLAKSQAQADASRKAADDLKASVAVKDDYAAADAVYQQAVKERASGDIANSSKDFDSARQQFDAVAAAAQKKKDAALQAMQNATDQQTASQKNADDAEKSLKSEGIAIPAAAQ